LQQNNIVGTVPESICFQVNEKLMRELWTDCGFRRDEQGTKSQEVECECCTQCFVDFDVNREPDILIQLQEISEKEVLGNPEMPQNQAVNWILRDDPQSMHPKNNDLVQRYLIALFGFALLPSNHDSQNSTWFSEETVCKWSGIICDESLKVMAIDMGK